MFLSPLCISLVLLADVRHCRCCFLPLTPLLARRPLVAAATRPPSTPATAARLPHPSMSTQFCCSLAADAHRHPSMFAQCCCSLTAIAHHRCSPADAINASRPCLPAATARLPMPTRSPLKPTDARRRSLLLPLAC
jgi:hypothetical protein